MAYDDELAARIRDAIGDRLDVTEKKMFGGLCILVNGNMAVGVTGEELMVRVGPEEYAEALSRPHAREMDFTGKALKGFVYVAPEGLRSSSVLDGWVARGIEFAASLPSKTAGGSA